MHVVMDMPATGREWQELRERRSMSVAELAALTDLQASTLHRLEAGAHVTRSTRKLVAAALGLRVFDESKAAA